MERSPLVPWVDDIYDVHEVMLWISEALRENDQEGSYGLVVGMNVKNEVFPAVVFGFPNVDSVAVHGEGLGLPFYVRPDRMTNDATNLFSCPWAWNPIRDEVITLSGLSIGGASCLEDAGSFGGFLVDDGGDIHGMTARHCVPGMRDGDPITSPSSLELTARFQYIVNYTQYQPEKFVRRIARVREAEELLNTYRFVDRADGVPCKIERNPRTIMLEGPKIGIVEHVAFENKAGLLSAHNARLTAASEKPFPELPPDVLSRLDYAIYSVESK